MISMLNTLVEIIYTSLERIVYYAFIPLKEESKPIASKVEGRLFLQ